MINITGGISVSGPSGSGSGLGGLVTGLVEPVDDITGGISDLLVGTDEGSLGGLGIIQLLDLLPPTLSITADNVSLGLGETSLITFNFSEAVNGFDLTDILAVGGGLTNFTQLTANIFTAVFTPLANTLLNIGAVVVETGSFLDTALNLGVGNTLAIVLPPSNGGDPNVFFGTPGADTLTGTNGDDTFYGGSGDDLMIGNGGNDQYVINDQGDFIQEEAGGGIDTAFVLASNWVISPNVEITRLYAPGVSVTGGAAAETIVAYSDGGSTIDGGGGDDTIWGSSLAETLMGGAGNDIIRGQGDNDLMVGGTGNDQFVVFGAGTQVVEAAGEGIDTIYVAVNGFTAGPNVEIIRLSAAGVVNVQGSNTAEDIVANQAEASTLFGNGGNDRLWGSVFNDSLFGGEGDDILLGQGGNDSFIGGRGNDQFVVFGAGSTITEAAGEGYDIAYFVGSGTFSLGSFVEEARLSANGTSIIANDQANLLVGNSSGLASRIEAGGGDDIIYGSTSNDTLIGGAGNDTFYSEGGADLFQYAAGGWGYDQIAGFTQGQAKLDFSGSGLSFADLGLELANGNTQVQFGADAVLVFGATLNVNDFIF